ncbi:DMT family transporter [Amycolatopsis sp. 195334CR]|uniref:DMT family transporter n=1 Tax=Amycolatopsis sp. 195334CR TaxID=2814588 RepID=UPI001A903E4E|nr:DMT family transporter [Amycolatopsis sp. 195334CR]MBN6040099.1 DMT family transporter [Amycolatopsis sp. 195334CR]
MSSRGVPWQFAALALAWGSSFLFMKVGLAGLSPVQLVTARMALGALALLVLVVVRRVPLPRSARALAHIGVVSLFLCVLPFLLFAWAGERINSGLSSIFNATTPLMTLLITLVALRAERPHRGQLAGLGLGLAGVLVVLAPWQLTGVTGGITAQLACLAATASYGLAFVYLRRFVSPLGLPAIAVATVQVGLGAVPLLATVPFLDPHPVTLTPAVVLSVLGLGVFGTGLAYVWNTGIVAAWGAAVASSVTYLTPVIGVALGAVVLGEAITWNQPAGAVLVVAGIVLSRGAKGGSRPPAPARTPAASTAGATPTRPTVRRADRAGAPARDR